MRTWFCLLALAGLGTSAQAVEYARVLSAEPIYREFHEPVARQVCHQRPVRYVEPAYAYQRRGSDSGVVLGAILGGMVGNQFGRGNGRAAATVAGVALGSAIASDLQRQDRYGYDSGYGYYRDGRVIESSERVCEWIEDGRRERRLVGFDVTYDYHGRIGHTVTRRHPGDRIAVRVHVDALEDDHGYAEDPYAYADPYARDSDYDLQGTPYVPDESPAVFDWVEPQH